MSKQAVHIVTTGLSRFQCGHHPSRHRLVVTDPIQIKIKDWSTMKVINLLWRRDRVVAKSLIVIPDVSPPTRCVRALSLVGFRITLWSEWCITCLCRRPCPNKHRFINGDPKKYSIYCLHNFVLYKNMNMLLWRWSSTQVRRARTRLLSVLTAFNLITVTFF